MMLATIIQQYNVCSCPKNFCDTTIRFWGLIGQYQYLDTVKRQTQSFLSASLRCNNKAQQNLVHTQKTYAVHNNAHFAENV